MKNKENSPRRHGDTENVEGLAVTLRVLRASVVSLFLAIPSALFACPLCRETARESSEALAEGFNASTLVMLGGLFSLMGLSVFFFVRAARPVNVSGAPAPPEPSGRTPR